MERYLRLNCLFFTSRMGHKRAIWGFMISVTNTFTVKKIVHLHISLEPQFCYWLPPSEGSVQAKRNIPQTLVLPDLGLNPAQIIKVVSLINPPAHPLAGTKPKRLNCLFHLHILTVLVQTFNTCHMKIMENNATFRRGLGICVAFSKHAAEKKNLKGTD